MAKIVRIISLNRNPRLNEFGPTDLVLNSKTGELFSKANNQLIRVIARNVSNLKPPTNAEIQNIKPESRLNRGLSNEDVLNNLTSDNINTLKQGKSITNSTISEDTSYSQFLRPEAIFSDSDTSTYTKYTIPGRIGTFVSGTLFFDLNQSSSNNYVALGTTNTQLRLTGNITASGAISASGNLVVGGESTFNDAVTFPKLVKLYFDSISGMHIYSEGTATDENQIILAKTNNLRILNQAHGKDIEFGTENASGTAKTPLILSGSGDATFGGNLTVTSNISASGTIVGSTLTGTIDGGSF